MVVLFTGVPIAVCTYGVIGESYLFNSINAAFGVKINAKASVAGV